jgi:DinB family protein
MHPRTCELLEYLDAQRARLRAAYDAVPPAIRETPPAPGRWSPAAIIEHLAIVGARIAQMLASEITAMRAQGAGAETSTDPILPTMDLARVQNRSRPVTAPDRLQPTNLGAEAAWEALEHAGAALRAAALAGDGLALGLVMYPHPILGPISLYEWIAFVGAHEARHAAQIEEITGAMGTEGTATK